MSAQLNRLFNEWSAFRVQLEKKIADVNRYSRGSSESVSYALVVWALAIPDIIPIPVYTPEQLRQWLAQLVTTPLSDVHVLLKESASFIRKYSIEERSTPLTYRSFKHYVYNGSTCDPLYPIRVELGQYLKHHNPISMGRCLSFCEFWSRIPIQDPTLEQKAVDDYLNCESKVFTSDRLDKSLTWQLRDEIQAVVKTFAIQPGKPLNFSGNAYAEGRGGSGILNRQNFGRVVPGTKEYRFALRSDLLDQCVGMCAPSNSARFATVPKNISKLRSISMEPAIRMAYQKYILSELDPFLSSCAWRITLHDQTRNRDLARQGSTDRKYGTIDLSNASDLVSNDLVKEVFCGTELYYLTQYTRSPSVTGPFGEIQLKKFAPMGSALCFPIECIIFAGIISLANRLKGVRTRFCVYGDDIVCHDRIFLTSLELLTKFGFEINRDKTFFPYHPFKESCGGEYLYGHDVTPFRLSRQLRLDTYSLRRSPEALSSMVEAINSLEAKGFHLASRWLLNRVLRIHPKVPFTRDLDADGVYTTVSGPINYHLKIDEVRSKAYQDTYVKAVGLVAQRQSNPEYDYSVQSWCAQAELSNRTKVALPEDQIGSALYPVRSKLLNVSLPKER